MSSKVKRLQKLNNQLDEKINADNQTIFTDMICYIRSADISDYNQELIRYDLSEMILSAQERGEDIHRVIGGDFKEFCDEVIANLPPKTAREKICDGLDIFCSCVAILGIINILFSKDFYRVLDEIFSGQSVNYKVGITLGMMISTAVILLAAVFIVSMVTNNALNQSGDAGKFNRVVIGGITSAGIMGLFIIIAKFGKQVVFSVNIFLAVAVLVGLFAAHKLLSRI